MKSYLLMVSMGLAISTGQVLADDCEALIAEHGGAVYHCMLVANDGTSTKRANACFLDLDAGFAWLAKQGSQVKGRFMKADCRNDSETVRYRDWAQAKGMTVDPNFREPKSETSPAAESAAGQLEGQERQ